MMMCKGIIFKMNKFIVFHTTILLLSILHHFHNYTDKRITSCSTVEDEKRVGEKQLIRITFFYRIGTKNNSFHHHCLNQLRKLIEFVCY